MGFGPLPSGGIGGTTGTTDNAIARADGTGGNTLQGSLATVDDTGGINAPGNCLFAGCFLPTTARVFCQQDLLIQAGHTLSFEGGFSNTGDLFVVRAAPNTLALQNGANGQTWIVSRTFTDSSNYSQFKTIVTGSVVAFTVSELGTGVGTLTGYTFDKSVTAPNIPVVDTGWTANADGGSKTVIIGSSASNATIGTALDLVTSGAGTLLKNTAEKVKALEAALVALLLPNA